VKKNPKLINNSACRNDSFMTPDLIAACGINCGVCSLYLAYANKIRQAKGRIRHCEGCNVVGGKCTRCKTGKISKVEFCFECKDFPCDMLKRLEKRYKNGYARQESPIDNLKYIKKYGMKKFLAEEREEWKCSKCGGVICVHNGKCYHCEKVTHWKKG